MPAKTSQRNCNVIRLCAHVTVYHMHTWSLLHYIQLRVTRSSVKVSEQVSACTYTYTFGKYCKANQRLR
uniref:Uncharacterized protein n=1 Tax=Anguilla anguilla TaxID=7936 RepID=A0A0E9W455_ANGAN